MWAALESLVTRWRDPVAEKQREMAFQAGLAHAINLVEMMIDGDSDDCCADTEATAVAAIRTSVQSPTESGGISIEAIVQTYWDMHEIATDMGYPSCTEALEHLDELRAPKESDGARLARIRAEHAP